MSARLAWLRYHLPDPWHTMPDPDTVNHKDTGHTQMAKSKKYAYRVIQDNNSWTTEINRRVTSRVTVVTKNQAGFASEDEAIAWGQAQVKALLKSTNLNERNKRRASKADHS